MSDLVIVESPAKARTISRFLGNKYKIEASMGHIRDLPKSDLGVDVENNFEPKYIVPRDKKKRVNELLKLAQNADHIWLASDPDREGEAIAWHIAELIQADGKTKKKPKKGEKVKVIKDDPLRIRRVEFHEITEHAIKEAFEHPREVNIKLVDAQQARRVLDRLVGYKLSPLLWRKVKRGLSAGRVQSVALRLVVEREREIDAFVAVEYWSIEALVALEGKADKSFTVTLIELNDKKLEVGNEKEALEHVQILEKAQYKINEVKKRQVKRSPAPPFTTSTLQQTSGNRLGFTAKKTMMLAQNLYEQGLITYMRTDSVNLSVLALTQAKDYLEQSVGREYALAKPRFFKSRSKNAQEAHEAIRPTNFNMSAEQIPGENFTRDHRRLYDLIWKRALASQMSEALIEQTSIDVIASFNDLNYKLRATGSVIKFDGWLKLYGVKQLEDETGDKANEEEGEQPKKQILPEVEEGQILNLEKVMPEQHFTQPPPRYTESSLVKKLEELGIGRPSTYAPTLSTIQERFYVEREERKFKPTALGMAVTDFLVKYFPSIFDYSFTASLEDQLDDIALGEREWRKTISEFYLPFEKTLNETGETAEKVTLEVETTDKICPTCGKNLVVRTGRFGKFLACSGFPECKYTEQLANKINAKCPDDGGDIVYRRTKKGRGFYGCKNYPECKYATWTKPKELKATEESED